MRCIFVAQNHFVNPNIIEPNQTKALLLAKRELPVLVWDAVNLEGIHLTLVEVQDALDGIKMNVHPSGDYTIALNQAAAWQVLFDAVEQNTFSLDQQFVCDLHAIAGAEEALSWGAFRTGGVTIAGTDYQPPVATELNVLWLDMVKKSQQIAGVYEQAIWVFLQMARTQFFYDVNKRMGRFMMNGLLLSQGYPAINLPAKRQQEFNELMLAFYADGDVTDMTQFMLSCLSPQLVTIMSE